jgi:hypothetical protein
MNIYELPTALVVGDSEYAIRTDFRAIIDICQYYANPEYDAEEKALICLDILYEDFDNMPAELYQEALDRAIEFIDYQASSGAEHDDKHGSEPPITDWDQDAQLILGAVNAVARMDVRSVPYLHWWTFMSWYMEIPHDSLYATVISVRQAKRKGKLESWQKDFYKANRALVDLKTRKSADEMAADEEWKAAIDSLLGKK